MFSSDKGQLRFLILMISRLLTLVILLESFGEGKPLSYTNAASASDLKPQTVGPPSYWIGSHTLDFTPNPFLRERQSRSNTFGLESKIVETSAVTPGTDTSTDDTTTTSTPKPFRRGRKVKGRRKILNGNRTSNKSSGDFIEQKDPKENLEKSEDKFHERHLDVTESLRTSAIMTESLWPGQVLDVPPTKPTLPTHELISITTPEPIIPDYLDPHINQIPVDFARVHPEKLNPSYFRNIILKAMMDRLVGVGLATHTPSTLIHD